MFCIEEILSHADADSHLSTLRLIRTVVLTLKDLSLEERAVQLDDCTKDILFEYLEARLADLNLEFISVIAEILSNLAVHDLRKVRSRCTKPKPTLIDLLVDALHASEVSEALVGSLADLLRQLLEPSLTADSFISTVYEDGLLEHLSRPLLEVGSGSPFLQQTILDLFAFCVCSHSYIAKAQFLRFGSLFKALRGILTGASGGSKLVLLAGIRLVRAFLWQKDPLYLKCLSAFNIPGLILQLIQVHRPTGFTEGNMIYSGALEVMTFVCVNSQVAVMETLCRPGSESEELVRTLAEDGIAKSHSELANFMLATVDRLTSQYLMSGGEDLNSRHSIGSSRGRSQSPHPLVVPMPSRRLPRDFAEDDELEEDEIIPKTPGGSPPETPTDNQAFPPEIPSPQESPSQPLKRRRFSTDSLSEESPRRFEDL